MPQINAKQYKGHWEPGRTVEISADPSANTAWKEEHREHWTENCREGLKVKNIPQPVYKQKMKIVKENKKPSVGGKMKQLKVRENSCKTYCQ